MNVKIKMIQEGVNKWNKHKFRGFKFSMQGRLFLQLAPFIFSVLWLPEPGNKLQIEERGPP